MKEISSKEEALRVLEKGGDTNALGGDSLEDAGREPNCILFGLSL